jgi:hypothetical protein
MLEVYYRYLPMYQILQQQKGGAGSPTGGVATALEPALPPNQAK